MARIYSEYGMETMRRLERLIFLKHFGAAACTACFTSFLISLVPLTIRLVTKNRKFENFIIPPVLFILTVIARLENIDKLRQHAAELENLSGSIGK